MLDQNIFRLSGSLIGHEHSSITDQDLLQTCSYLHCIIDYRDYVYGIGNECAPPIVMYWNVLKHFPEYLALVKI